MLLEHGEVVVSPRGQKLHDHIIARLELESMGIANMSKQWYCLITLGDALIQQEEIRAHTNSFALSGIDGADAIYEAWRKIRWSGRYEQGYPHFLLCFLRETTGIQVEFNIQEERVTHFFVTLGNLKLQGRIPSDVDILLSHFGVLEESMSD